MSLCSIKFIAHSNTQRCERRLISISFYSAGAHSTLEKEMVTISHNSLLHVTKDTNIQMKAAAASENITKYLNNGIYQILT